jgi:hypothetical protein
MKKMFGCLFNSISCKPIVACAAVTTASITSAGVIDYNRENIDVKFVPRPTTHIGEIVLLIHCSGFCDESSFVNDDIVL